VKVRIEYGREGLAAEFPSGTVVLKPGDVSPLAEPDRKLAESLDNPIGTAPLRSLAQGRRSACVVVSDITRPVPNKLILPPLLRALESSGINRNKITILVATGLHRPATEDELVGMLGREITAGYRVVNHEARRLDELTALGCTPRGKTPVFVNRRYVESDFKILTGLIEPHFFAGFSGGYKSISPGIAGLDTIRNTHGPEILADPSCSEGVTKGNPFVAEGFAVAASAGCDFIVNVTLNREREITGIFCGSLREAYECGVEFAGRTLRVEVREPYDVVVTTGGGYPLDTTFYQSIKGLTAALPAVRRGGVIVLAAECREGWGDAEFTRLIGDFREPGGFLRRLFQPGFFRDGQWQVQKLCQVLDRAKVIVFSGGLARRPRIDIPLTFAGSMSAAVESALDVAGKGSRMAVIPQGPYVLLG